MGGPQEPKITNRKAVEVVTGNRKQKNPLKTCGSLGGELNWALGK